MGLAQIIQIINMVPAIIAAVESIKGNSSGEVKRETVKLAVLSSAAVSESFKLLNVKDQKAFNSGLDKVIDGIVKMLNASEWKK